MGGQLAVDQPVNFAALAADFKADDRGLVGAGALDHCAVGDADDAQSAGWLGLTLAAVGPGGRVGQGAQVAAQPRFQRGWPAGGFDLAARLLAAFRRDAAAAAGVDFVLVAHLAAAQAVREGWRGGVVE